MTDKSTAVFGSAFNPPHLGHADVIGQALNSFDRVLVVPSFCHPFGKQMLDYERRVALVEAMLRDLDDPRVALSRVEQTLGESRPGQPVYTYDVLVALEQVLGSADLVFVVGPDNAKRETWQKFYRADDIVQRWRLWPAQERLPVRSSQIRELLERKQLPTRDQCCDGVITLLGQWQL